MKCTTSG